MPVKPQRSATRPPLLLGHKAAILALGACRAKVSVGGGHLQSFATRVRQPDPPLPWWHDQQRAADESGGWPDNGKAGRRSGEHRANQGQGIRSPPPPAPTRPRSRRRIQGRRSNSRPETCRSSRAQRDKRANSGARELEPLRACSASPGSGASILSAHTIQAVQVFSPKHRRPSPGCLQRLAIPGGRNAKAKIVPAEVSKDYVAKAHVGHLAASPRLRRACRIGYRKQQRMPPSGRRARLSWRCAACSLRRPGPAAPMRSLCPTPMHPPS